MLSPHHVAEAYRQVHGAKQRSFAITRDARNSEVRFDAAHLTMMQFRAGGSKLRVRSKMPFPNFFGRKANQFQARVERARIELRTLSQMLAVQGVPPVTGIAAIIGLTIQHGAPIYNEGSHAGCAEIYSFAAQLVLSLTETTAARAAGLESVAGHFGAVGTSPITPENATQRAWELRRAFDTTVEDLRKVQERLTPRIFISYRRDSASAYARLLYESLQREFGKNVFLDIESIRIGENFKERLREELAACCALVVVIDRAWLGRKGDGSRRIDQIDDYVRLELEEALRRKIRLVPVLVDGATMPTSAELPESLREVTDWHFTHVSSDRMAYDLQRLVVALKQ